MYGQSSLSTYVGIGLAALLVIALFVLASPLFAIAIAAIIGVFMLGAMVLIRRRSKREDEHRPPPLTPEGKPTGATGSRSRGAPASGER